MAFVSGTGLNTLTSATVTIPAGTNRMGIIAIPFECTTIPSPITATLGGTSLGTATVATSSVGIEGVVLFVANDSLLTTIGTGSKSLSVSMTGGSGIQGRQSVYAFFSGRSQSAPVITTNNNTTPPMTVSCTAVGSSVDIVAVCGLNNAGTTTAGSGWTAFYNAADSGGDAQGCGIYQEAVAAGSYTPTVNNTGTPQWGMVGVVFEAFSAGPSIAVLTADNFRRRRVNQI